MQSDSGPPIWYALSIYDLDTFMHSYMGCRKAVSGICVCFYAGSPVNSYLSGLLSALTIYKRRQGRSYNGCLKYLGLESFCVFLCRAPCAFLYRVHNASVSGILQALLCAAPCALVSCVIHAIVSGRLHAVVCRSFPQLYHPRSFW